MRKFLILLLAILFAFTACDNSVKPIRFAFGESASGNDNQKPEKAPEAKPLEPVYQEIDSYVLKPLTIKCTAEHGGMISFTGNTSNMRFSRNKGEKEEIQQNQIQAFKDDEIQLYAYNTSGIKITCRGECEVYGNIMSLLCENDEFTGFVKKDKVPAGAFNMLFSDSDIVSAENLILPAKDLTGANNCYSYMFAGCSNLKKPPVLPATTLAQGCYDSMFIQCSNLENAPELPATTLAVGCYRMMFNGCKMLTQAPVLPAPELAQNCYQYMFQNCENLNSVTCFATTVPSSKYTDQWLSGVAKQGTFTRKEGVYWPTNSSYNAYGYPKGWEYLPSVKEADPDDYSTPLTIKVLKGGNGYIINIQNAPNGMKYSFDDEEVKRTINYGQPSIEAGRDGTIIRLYAKETGNGKKSNSGSFLRITCSQEFEVYGNIMSLYCDDDYNIQENPTLEKNAFRELFYDTRSSSHLKSAENLLLPETVTEDCYNSMFKNCGDLTKAPILPATELEKGCYADMFNGCANLESLTCLASTAPSDTTYTYNWLSGAGTKVEGEEKPVFHHATASDWPKDSNYGVPSTWHQDNQIPPQFQE